MFASVSATKSNVKVGVIYNFAANGISSGTTGNPSHYCDDTADRGSLIRVAGYGKHITPNNSIPSLQSSAARIGVNEHATG
ncbi:hypothetical protein PM082_009521 [Marasmius tenuissimus]|nr:hypothetical protein PM082_009521 [Marasmius tenuissimus]